MGLKAWVESASREQVRDAVALHHGGLAATVKLAFPMFQQWKGKGKGKCKGFGKGKSTGNCGKGKWQEHLQHLFGSPDCSPVDRFNLHGADWCAWKRRRCNAGPWMGMLKGMFMQKGLGKGWKGNDPTALASEAAVANAPSAPATTSASEAPAMPDGVA